MTETSGRRSPDDFIVYQGFSLPSSLASSVNLFFPTASPLEKSSHYLNLLGLVRTSRLVLSPLKTTYTDPQIIRFFHRFALRYLSLPISSGPTFYLTALRLSLARENFPWKGDFVEGFKQHHGIFLEHN